MKRRSVLKYALLSGPAVYGAQWLRSDDPAYAADLLLPSPKATPFQAPLPMPSVLRPVNPSTLPGVPRFPDPTDYYLITARQSLAQVYPNGPPTLIWGYEGVAPGPTIMAQVGRRVVVRQVNRLDTANTSVVHLHGGHTPPVSDGGAFAEQAFGNGQFRDYVYPNDNPIAATLWYHDHYLDFTGRNVYMGLSGFYFLKDAFEADLVASGRLPGPAYDIPLVFQDRVYDRNNQLVYNPFDHDGFLGDTFIVNGAIQPRLKVANRRYRFRMLNGANARFYGLSLSSGQPMTIIAGDQGLLEHPVEVDRLFFGMAERYEVIIDFSRYKVPTQVFLNNCLVQKKGRGPEDFDRRQCVPMLRFDVEIDNPDRNAQPIPDPLRTDFPIVRVKDSVLTRRWEFDRRQGAWQINNNFFDEDRVDARPVLGTTEIWSLRNGGGGWFHPIHFHDEYGRILDRNGRPPLPQETGLKDTVVLHPDDVVRVLIKWTGNDNRGKYMIHCHNIEHEDMRMMARFDVVSPAVAAAEHARVAASPPPGPAQRPI